MAKTSKNQAAATARSGKSRPTPAGTKATLVKRVKSAPNAAGRGAKGMNSGRKGY